MMDISRWTVRSRSVKGCVVTCCLVGLVWLFSHPVFGQSDQHLVPFEQQKPNGTETIQLNVTSEAGYVNLVTGEASVLGIRSKNWQPLVAGGSLEIGDTIKTNHQAQVEILLMPGSYLRLAGGTTLTLKAVEFDVVHFDIQAGSVDLEWFGTEYTEMVVSLTCPNHQIVVFPTTQCRLEVGQNNTAEFYLWSGKAQVFNPLQSEITGMKRVTFRDSSTQVRALKLPTTDPFFDWCRSRSRILFASTRHLLMGRVKTTSEKPLVGFGLNSYFEPYRFVDHIQFQVLSQAGLVSFTRGEAQVQRKDETVLESLDVGDLLADEDKIRTGPHSYLEVLLGFGSVIWLDAGTTWIVKNTRFDQFEMELETGSSIIEFPGYEQIKLNPTIVLAQTKLKLQLEGRYRFETTGEQRGRCLVYKGEVQNGVTGPGRHGAPKQLVFKSGQLLESEISKPPEDVFYKWTRERARILGAYFDQVYTSRKGDSLIDGYSGLWGYGNAPLSNAIWVWSPSRSCYGFYCRNVSGQTESRFVELEYVWRPRYYLYRNRWVKQQRSLLKNKIQSSGKTL
ncbi:MAG TPA: hypothetical protein PLS70_23085 [Acidobacteriota bacterium]|nr:hypothetical protein [Acidobacteriota bacterium]